MKKVEAPCSTDGESCLWIIEDEYTNDGKLVSDSYCEKCFRYRDWSKDEFKKN